MRSTGLMLGTCFAITVLASGTVRAQGPEDRDSAANQTAGVVRVEVASVAARPLAPLAVLLGRIPGSLIATTNGRPGATPDVGLRVGGLGGHGAPLILIDGVVADNGVLGINPADIERVEVLRGAAAAALYGARAGDGVIMITSRLRRADRTTVTVRSELAASDVERRVPQPRQTMLLTDSRGGRYCIVVPDQPLCARTIDWATELARINGHPEDTVATPASLVVDPTRPMTTELLANRFQVTPWPGRTYNHSRQALARSGAVSRSEVDWAGPLGDLDVHGSLSLLTQPGALRFVEGYRRYTARLNVGRRIGRFWTVALSGFGSRESDAAQGAYESALSSTILQPPVSDLLARDSLGRPYARTTLLGLSGPLVINPPTLMNVLLGRPEHSRTTRYSVALFSRFAPAAWLETEARASLDRVGFSQIREYDGLGRGGSGLLLDYGTWSRSVAISLGATVRRPLGEAIRTTSSVMMERRQHDQRGRWTSLSPTTLETRPSAGYLNLAVSTNLTLHDRYVLDAAIRRDSRSLGDLAPEWETSGRVGAAWQASREAWWPAVGPISDVVVRASYGSAGGWPNRPLLHEALPLPSAVPGVRLEPVRETEIQVGTDFRLMRALAVRLRYAVADQSDGTFVADGLGDVLEVAGTTESRTWELSATAPLISRRDLEWSVTVGYDRLRSTISGLRIPPFSYGAEQMFLANPGERFGAIYGRRFISSCAELPPAFRAACGGPGTQFQVNDDGFVVWTGGFGWNEGITRNLWGTSLPGSSAPWGVPLNWGAPILLRDTMCIASPSATCPAGIVRLGTGLPEWQLSVSTSLRWRRVTLFALAQGSFGREVWNRARHWNYLQLLSAESDQAGRSAETAKPSGYYWRGAPPDAPGYGGLYDYLTPNSHFVESTSYVKLRELAITLDVGSVAGLGEWSVSLTGRNLATLTDYRGYDPEVPFTRADSYLGDLSATDDLAFPNLRTVGISLAVRF